MKLLNITAKYFLLLLFSVLLIWSIVFYYTIQAEIYENIDEFLLNRKFVIIQEIKNNPIEASFPLTDFTIERISKRKFDAFHENFKDVDIFEPLEKEDEPYRKLETSFSNSKGYFKLTIIESLMDAEELISTILINIILLFIVFLVLLWFLNRLLLRKLWNPFYTTLQELKKYRLDKDVPITFASTPISEFKELNDSISKLIDNNRQSFQNQKHFIENASHEIQTPLSIASGKLELLIQNPDVTEELAEVIQSIGQNLERLSGLNKSLLLLSKIENDQFPNLEEISVNEMVKKITEDFEELIQFKNIHLTFNENGELTLMLNPDLASILFSNLIKNAIYHNVQDGYINISINKDTFIIDNTGKITEENPSRMFERFTKKSDNQSLGLGLSIALSICNLYHYKILYSTEKKTHTISLNL